MFLDSTLKIKIMQKKQTNIHENRGGVGGIKEDISSVDML